MAHETLFEDGSLITSYLATAYAEGFCEGEDASIINRCKAWSYLCGTGTGFKLQGWFGRTINDLIEKGILETDGTLHLDSIVEDE